MTPRASSAAFFSDPCADVPPRIRALLTGGVQRPPVPGSAEASAAVARASALLAAEDERPAQRRGGPVVRRDGTRRRDTHDPKGRAREVTASVTRSVRDVG